MAGHKAGRNEKIERSGKSPRGHSATGGGPAKSLDPVKRAEAIARLQVIAENVAAPLGIEVVEVEWKGSGRNQLLRIFIDKVTGVTHTDCELISHQVSSILDADDPVSGSYELEVSSPGVERKLKKVADWRRFIGQKAKVVLKEPAADLKYFDGIISLVQDPAPQDLDLPESGAANPVIDPEITVELTGGRRITFAFSQVDRANLKFEW